MRDWNATTNFQDISIFWYITMTSKLVSKIPDSSYIWDYLSVAEKRLSCSFGQSGRASACFNIQSWLYNLRVTGRVRKEFNHFIGLLSMSCPMVGQLPDHSKYSASYWSTHCFRLRLSSISAVVEKRIAHWPFYKHTFNNIRSIVTYR